MEVIGIQILVFSSIMLMVIGVNALIRGETVNLDDKRPMFFRVFSNEIATLGKIVGPSIDYASPYQVTRIRNDLIAGALAPLEVMEIRGCQAFVCLIMGATSGTLTFLISLNWSYSLIALIAFALLGWIYPVTWVAGIAARRKDKMSKSMPYAIDLITVAMQAGQDFGAAVRHLVNEGPTGPLRQEFAVTLKEVELGKSRIEALKSMTDRVQLDEFQALVTSVAQSSEMGASIAATLKIQAEEIRRTRYHKAERQAARAPSLMLIPTALFILPSVFIVIIVPIMLRIKDSDIAGFIKT
ncbi:MAG: type II secretion system F family protein [Kiritimatiellae bacterium]|nr:type II secretion system F family protein [Kiritimatiellia bacterium]